jgi:hypothetical protein
VFEQIRREILNHYTYGDLDFREIEKAMEELASVEAIYAKALRKREEKWDKHEVPEWERELMR